MRMIWSSIQHSFFGWAKAFHLLTASDHWMMASHMSWHVAGAERNGVVPRQRCIMITMRQGILAKAIQSGVEIIGKNRKSSSLFGTTIWWLLCGSWEPRAWHDHEEGSGNGGGTTKTEYNLFTTPSLGTKCSSNLFRLVNLMMLSSND